MPRRNEILKPNQTYWVKQPNGMGYRVWTKKVLDKCIAEGKITDQDMVQIAVSAGQ